MVWFRSLDAEAIQAVVRKELQDITKRQGMADRELTLDCDDLVAAKLAEIGFDPVYGARPLQRAIDETITLPLGKYLVERPDLRNATIQVSWKGEGVEFSA